MCSLCSHTSKMFFNGPIILENNYHSSKMFSLCSHGSKMFAYSPVIFKCFLMAPLLQFQPIHMLLRFPSSAHTPLGLVHMGKMRDAKLPCLETWLHKMVEALGAVQPTYRAGILGLAYAGCTVLGATHWLSQGHLYSSCGHPHPMGTGDLSFWAGVASLSMRTCSYSHVC